MMQNGMNMQKNMTSSDYRSMIRDRDNQMEKFDYMKGNNMNKMYTQHMVPSQVLY